MNIVVFGGLSVLCAAIYAGMRTEPALAWLAAALLIGSVEVLVLSQLQSSNAELVAITLLLPAAYLCVGQSIRLTTRSAQRHGALIGTVAGLAAGSLVLLALDVPFIYQTLPLQTACAMAILDSVWRLAKADERSWLDTALAVALCLVSGIFLVRLPLFPMLFDGTASYHAVKTSGLETTLLTLSGLVTPLVVFLLLARIISGVITDYRRRSERDAMTGLLNRRGFDQSLSRTLKRGGAVILCDIDHFKQVNDSYGHAVGDTIIRAFGDLIGRSGYRAGRIGGEEFALILPDCSARQAARVAETLRLTFYRTEHEALAAGHRISASFGIAGFTPTDTMDAVLLAADRALYRAKDNGRNRVVISAPSETAAELRHAA
ncbi:MAG: GGDEF domain-containing protein [Aurantimonas coralicida]|uniref:GGDEF domain-containing protein n=1 Tax=Aurantimonas TaxID=182269 RepID=UPI0004626BBB|nr:GGDEF domain-containing protein [Aurantimonas coralicida]